MLPVASVPRDGHPALTEHDEEFLQISELLQFYQDTNRSGGNLDAGFWRAPVSTS
jgi:hypothetical protein